MRRCENCNRQILTLHLNTSRRTLRPDASHYPICLAWQVATNDVVTAATAAAAAYKDDDAHDDKDDYDEAISNSVTHLAIYTDGRINYAINKGNLKAT